MCPSGGNCVIKCIFLRDFYISLSIGTAIDKSLSKTHAGTNIREDGLKHIGSLIMKQL